MVSNQGRLIRYMLGDQLLFATTIVEGDRVIKGGACVWRAHGVVCGAIGADARPNWNEQAPVCLFGSNVLSAVDPDQCG